MSQSTPSLNDHRMHDYRHCSRVIEISNGMLVMKILTNVMSRIHRWDVFAQVRGMSGKEYMVV